MSEWKTFRIDEIGEVITGSTPSTKNKDYWNGTVLFYSPADFREQVYCYKTEKTISEQALLNSREIPDNAIMFTCIASIGKMAISSKFGITNQQINTLIPKVELFHFKFIYYILFFNRNLFTQLAPQTTIPIINKTDFSGFSFTIPTSLFEQRKVAQILSTVDAVIEKTETAIAKYKNIKAGMMRDLFTRGIVLKTGKLRPSCEETPELYKQSELGWMPKEWDINTIERATETITDFTANGSFESLRINVRYYYEPNYGRLIRLTDLRQELNTGGVFVDKDGFDYLSKSSLKENDILIANVGEYTGYSCLMPIVSYPSTLGPNMFLVRANLDLYTSNYLFYCMNYELFKKQLENISTSSATPLLNKTNFRKMYVPRAQKKEQDQISEILSTCDYHLKLEGIALRKYQSIKQALMSDLLTGKVRVKFEEEKEEAL